MISFSQVNQPLGERAIMTNLSFLEGPKVETSNTPPFEIEKGLKVVLWNLYRFQNMTKKPQRLNNPEDKTVMEKIKRGPPPSLSRASLEP